MVGSLSARYQPGGSFLYELQATKSSFVMPKTDQATGNQAMKAWTNVLVAICTVLLSAVDVEILLLPVRVRHV